MSAIVNSTTCSIKNKPGIPTPWARAILRWAGSKRRILPNLMANVPSEYERYVEPFCGSACLFFALRPKRAILGDTNEELIHCYRVMRRHPRLLARAVKRIPNTSTDYAAIRNLSPPELAPIDRAARFVYLNRFCFNGVYRTNREGKFNVPRGQRTGPVPDEAAFYRCSWALRKADLLLGDFEKSLEWIKNGDFVYLDPPYATQERTPIEEYGPNCFQHYDMPRLVASLENIDKKGATFLLSYAYSSSLIETIRDRWNIAVFNVRRHVSGFAKHRQLVSEVLISNIEITLPITK